MWIFIVKYIYATQQLKATWLKLIKQSWHNLNNVEIAVLLDDSINDRCASATWLNKAINLW